MKYRNFVMIGVLAGVIGLNGCATNMAGTMQSSGNAYSTAQAGVMQTVQIGTILALVPVKIAENGGGMGTATGAVAGGLLGNNIGHGAGSLLGAIGGAALGGLAGHAIEGAVSTQNGFQITVQLDNPAHQVVAITQAADIQLHVGEKVQVVGGYGTQARVQPLN